MSTYTSELHIVQVVNFVEHNCIDKFSLSVSYLQDADVIQALHAEDSPNE